MRTRTNKTLRTKKKKIFDCRVYPSGYPFSEPLNEDLDAFKKIVSRKKPCIMIICGKQGDGKTTLAVHCADYINEGPISFEKQLALGGKDFRAKLDNAFIEKLPVVIYDEAGDYTNIGFATKFNRIMNQVFNMNRAFGAVIIVCLPEIDELSKKILRSTQGSWRVHDRGLNDSNFSAYDYETTRYIVHYMKDRVVEENVYKFVWPEYRGVFLDLSPKRSKELDKYCMAGKRDIFHQQDIKEDDLHTAREMAGLCGRSLIWVKKKISLHNFSHTRVFKQTKYYSRAVLNALLDEVKNYGT